MDFEYCKIEIFLPEQFLPELRETLARAGAGHIGKYDCCLSWAKVYSSWRPLPGAKPYSGKEMAVSIEEEIKAEVTTRLDEVDEIVREIRKIHPYEEPVINVIPLWKTGIDY